MKTVIMMIGGALALAACGKDVGGDDQRAPAASAAQTSGGADTASQPAAAEALPSSAPRDDRPAAEVAPAALAGATYTVEQGDTLYGIAQSRSLSASDLARWNNISDPRRLRIGQELRLTPP